MSSRFVSAGAIDPTTGEAAPEQEQRPASNTTAGPDVPKPNDEWVAVEKELAAERRRRDEAKAAAAAGQEKSLFEILEANKGLGICFFFCLLPLLFFFSVLRAPD